VVPLVLLLLIGSGNYIAAFTRFPWSPLADTDLGTSDVSNVISVMRTC